MKLLRRNRTAIMGAAAVFLIAAALRLGHVEMMRRSLEGTHIFTTGRVDAAFHLGEAREIVEGNLWLHDRVHWKAPGYSYFLAALMTVLGRDVGSYRWVVALIGASNCAALALLARRFLRPSAATLSGMLAAANGVILLFDGELYHPTLLITLSLGMFGLLLRREGRALSAACAGLLLGLAVLVHPSYLLAGFAVLFWLARQGIRRALPFALAAALVVSPVALKNIFVLGQPVLVSWSGGINFYLGNQPGYDQTSGQSTQAWGRILNTPPDAGLRGEAERDRLYYRLAAKQILGSPATALRIFATKLMIFFSPVEISNNFRIYELREHSTILRTLIGRAGPLWWPFGLLAPLALAGIVLLHRRRVPGRWLVLLWTAALCFSCVLFFNTARYRAPAVFFASIWAAATIDAAWIAVRQRRWMHLAGGATAVALLAAAVAAIALPQKSLPPSIEDTEAKVLEQMGLHREAALMHGEACAKDPHDPGILLSAAAYHGRRGEHSLSRQYLRRMLATPDLGPDDRSNALEGLADSLLVEGRLDEAESAFMQALEVGVDEATWHGAPFFQMNLGPVTACRLELGLAEVEARRGRVPQAREIAGRVLKSCGPHGRIEKRLSELEPLLSVP